jgi:hypothetical protein
VTPSPRIRASHSKGTLRALQAVAPGAAGRVLAALPQPVREGLAGATGVDFLPARWDVELVRAIESVVEPAVARRIYRTTMVDALGGPLLGGLVSGALKLFGASPGGLYRWAGRAWGHLCQGSGELRLLEVGERSAVLVLDGMPPELAEPAYVHAVGATLESVLDVCGVTGTVETTPHAAGGRFLVRWTPKG